MKTNQFLVAIVSAAVTGGTLISFLGSAQACPFSDSSTPAQGLSNSSSSFINPANIGKTLGGSAILGGLLVGGVYLSRRSRQDKTATPDQAATYEALEFPPSLPEVEQVSQEQLASRK